jgi:hypothetical protein
MHFVNALWQWTQSVPVLRHRVKQALDACEQVFAAQLPSCAIAGSCTHTKTIIATIKARIVSSLASSRSEGNEFPSPG